MSLLLNNAPPELLALIKKPVPVKPKITYEPSSFSAKEVNEMLSYLNPDIDYDSWIKVGMALHSEGHDLSLWEAWSARGSKYKAGECKDKWHGFNGSGGVSMGTLVHMTKWAGYTPQNTIEPSLGTIHAPKSTAFKIYRWEDLQRLPRREYIIKGLLDQNSMSVVYGASNSGKTFIALDLACHIALGWNWCEKRTIKASVLYIAAEGGMGTQERLAAFKKHHNLTEYGEVYVLPTAVTLCKDKNSLNSLIAAAQGITDLKLIVIDTLARAMGSGDENSPSDMGALIQSCDKIREETSAHVMLVHHSGKDETRGARGHSALKAAVDTEIEVSQRDSVITAKTTKQREGKTGYALAFKLHEYMVRKDEDGDAVCSCALVQKDVTSNQKGRLTGQTKAAYQTFLNLLLEAGFDQIPKKGMQAQRCVRLEGFREHFYMAGHVETDDKGNMNRAFNRAKNKLKSMGYIHEWNGCIWRADNEDT